MADAWMLLAAFAASTIGFAWLALAMDTHWKQVHGTGLGRRRQVLLRGAGAIALGAALALCLAADPASMAVLEWMLLLAAAAVLVALALHWKSRALRWLCPW